MIATDLVIPYQVEHAGLRGRFLRFGPLLDRILDRHRYPPPVSALLGETLVLTALLGSTLKYLGSSPCRPMARDRCESSSAT